MNNIPAVKEAKRLGTVKIVSYEWLEDSLLSRNRTPKREKACLIENILKEERRTAKEEARKTLKQQGRSTKKSASKRTSMLSLNIYTYHLPNRAHIMMLGKLNAKSPSGTNRGKKSGPTTSERHVYTDMTARQTYKATLVRQTISKRKEKFQLTIYESNGEPCTYETECRYSRVGKSSSQILAPTGSSLDTALTAFERFFEEYTGKSWALREDGILPQPKRDDEDNLLPQHEGWYIYEATTNIFVDFIQNGSASSANIFGN
ncbi:BRCT domain protein [Aspergillus bombycis]|uniref:BRCT domain protein n=1 Tax=Aspergillus bombycis TaxID=109264 RepID=A0A1F8AAU8_9EURO|nr:BRCT domain protein [Aspergillus bombycis]OGM48545.1 BRCT domain protein [Aspergillus bombycis]